MQLCKGTTEISSVNITAQSSSSSTPDNADLFTTSSSNFSYADLANVKLKVKPGTASSSSRLFLYGAELTITYTVPTGTYIYTISNISANHTVVVSDVATGDKIYVKTNNTWKESNNIFVKNSSWESLSNVYKKISGSWVKQDDKSAMFDGNAIYITKN